MYLYTTVFGWIRCIYLIWKVFVFFFFFFFFYFTVRNIVVVVSMKHETTKTNCLMNNVRNFFELQLNSFVKRCFQCFCFLFTLRSQLREDFFFYFLIAVTIYCVDFVSFFRCHINNFLSLCACFCFFIFLKTQIVYTIHSFIHICWMIMWFCDSPTYFIEWKFFFLLFLLCVYRLHRFYSKNKK